MTPVYGCVDEMSLLSPDGSPSSHYHCESLQSSIGRVGKDYLIIAGATGEGGEASRLFEWNGRDQPKPMEGISLRGLNPEGVAFHGKDGVGEYFVLSDDGSRKIDGQDCKDLKDPELKTFRGRILRFPLTSKAAEVR